jgi:hypothetical protein
MPAIVAPAELPAPQELSALIVDTRLQTDASEKGPVELRTIEQDERQRQTLVWTLTEVEAAIFRLFWRVTLVYGGAWFSAPESWPDMHGLIVRVRRFISAPQWVNLGAGIWRVSITAECRGETLLPNEPEPDTGGEGWNVEDTTGLWVFTEDNYRGATAGNEGNGNIISVASQTNGARYAEFVLNAFSYPAPVDSNAIGITALLQGVEGWVYTDGGAIDTSTGVFTNNSFNQSFIETFELGDVVMMAIEFDETELRVWFGRNGDWFGDLPPDDPVSLGFSFERTSDAYWLGATAQSGFSFDVTLRTQADQFTETIPTGFSPWDS